MPDRSRCVWHPWLRVERLLRAILTERWNADQWKRIKGEIPKVYPERRRIRRMGFFN